VSWQTNGSVVTSDADQRRCWSWALRSVHCEISVLKEARSDCRQNCRFDGCFNSKKPRTMLNCSQPVVRCNFKDHRNDKRELKCCSISKAENLQQFTVEKLPPNPLPLKVSAFVTKRTSNDRIRSVEQVSSSIGRENAHKMMPATSELAYHISRGLLHFKNGQFKLLRFSAGF
jgi:hypothetical protein